MLIQVSQGYMRLVQVRSGLSRCHIMSG